MGANLTAVNLGPPNLLVAKALALGEAHSCALLQPGSVVKCWGYVCFRDPGMYTISCLPAHHLQAWQYIEQRRSLAGGAVQSEATALHHYS
jgi:hypothetical protein